MSTEPTPPDVEAHEPPATLYRATQVRSSAPAAAHGAPQVGTLLGDRYLLERELGEGGMGVVYFGRDQHVTGECFAVKVLRPEIRDHPDALEFLREEVRRTRALHHPNIVGVYSLNADPTGVYMLMEYLEGTTLSAIIDEDFGRGMPLLRAWPLIKDIGAALAYAHDHSVIHSDLKPSNIFVTHSGKATLLDFGIARAVRGRGKRADAGGSSALTPAYASCEMLEGGAAPDQRDDVYAFACVIYELLSGRHPFEGRTALEARAGALRPAPIPTLNRAQNKALARALAFDRAARTASVEALLSGLDRDRSSPARRKVEIGVAAGLIVLLGAGVWLFVHSRAAMPAKPDELLASSAISLRARMTRMTDRADQAKKMLAVDTSQKAWQTWLQQLSAARRMLSAGDPHAIQQLSDADAALLNVIHHGIRWMKIGSLPPEIDQALTLCRAAGGRCTEADFSGEKGRMAQLRPFDLDLAEVTNREFGEFAAATGYLTAAERARGLFDYSAKGPVLRSGQSWRTLRDALTASGLDPSDYPVRGIDFETAQAFCNWNHRRLPTGDEWEFVARGAERHVFPWGDDPLHGSEPAAFLPVTRQQATGRFGNRGLGGSLWEWVDDGGAAGSTAGSATQRSLRGASWRDRNAVDERLAMRRQEEPTHAYVDTGFRCARAADAWPDRDL